MKLSEITTPGVIELQQVMAGIRDDQAEALVTEILGAHTANPVSGDFSFGVEGYAFSKGKITHPVREMLITGNLVELWNSLIAAGTDARSSARWQIPSLAFDDVSFSA